MTNGTAARDVIAAGCGAVTVMDNPAFARELARDTSLTVFHRRVFGGALPISDAFIRWHGIDPNGYDEDARFVVLGCNENDAGVDDSPAGIEKRASWDRVNLGALQRCAPNVRYAGGGYAHGNINFADAAVAEAMRKHYAPLYAAGMLFNFHNYTKGKPGEIAPVWFERRWQFLFDVCGFDPNIRGIVSDETGIEGGSCGGFAGCGYSADDFAKWCDYYLTVQREAYQDKPSPLIASTIFQMGGNGDPQWARYDVGGYVGALKNLWGVRYA